MKYFDLKHVYAIALRWFGTFYNKPTPKYLNNGSNRGFPIPKDNALHTGLHSHFNTT